MKKCLLIILLLVCNLAYSQLTETDTLKIITSFLEKNINQSFYDYFNYETKFGIKLIKERDTISDINPHFKDFIIKKSNLSLKNYDLFEVKIKSIVTDSNGVKYNYKGSYFIDKWINENNILIGFSSKNILVLSGNIYHSKYSSLFFLDSPIKQVYLKFLELKLFSFQVSNIKYEKQNRKWIYFSGEKTVFSKKIKSYFRVRKDFPDLVEDLGHKISGKYREREKKRIY